MSVEEMTKQFVLLKESSPNIDEEDWTESDTRSKFIDTVLINCLGWDEKDIRREKSRDNTRLDYLLSTTRPVLVVEAKSSSKAFAVSKAKKPYRIKVKTLLKANPDLNTCIAQVSEYCWKWSVPIAVLTNGHTYIIFLAVRTDGVRLEDSDAIVISDIFQNRFNFADLHNLLSRNFITEGKLHTELYGGRPAEPPESVVSTYADSDAIKGANPIGLALQPLLEQLFTDVTQDDSPEVLEHCYVYPGSSTFRDEYFEALLLDKPPSFSSLSNVISVDSTNAYKQFQDSISQYLARQPRGQTLLVIGKVGVGKTMFLLRYFKVRPDNESSAQKETEAFFVDFRKPGVDPEDISCLIYTRLREQIEALDGREVPGENKQYDLLSSEGLKQVFWPQVQKWEKGFDKRLCDGDPSALIKGRQKLIDELRESDESFVKGAVRVLRERYHRYVCVILDNADVCEPSYQKAVYLFSRTLQDALQCLVIVALREEWYWYFGIRTTNGPFSAYHDTTYHIPPPRSRDVLAKRLEYAINLAREHRLPSTEITLSGNVVIKAQHLERYLNICRKAFFEDEEITVFFECFSSGSVRKGLNAFLEFLRSGHTHVDEYLKAFAIGGSYRLLFHQVFKSIAYNDYTYYASAHSKVPNVFSPVFSANYLYMTYFARLYLLDMLDGHSKTHVEAGIGYVAQHDVDAFLDRLGVPPPLQTSLLEECIRTDVIEPDICLLNDKWEWKYLRITSFGRYLLNSLSNKFCYLEAVMLDTPVLNGEVRKMIARIYAEGVKPILESRFTAVSKFVDYLQQLESEEQVRIESAGLAPLGSAVMPSISSAVRAEMQGIKAKVTRKA